MKPVHLFIMVGILLTVLLACQKMQLPFQKDQQENKHPEKAQIDDRQGEHVKTPEQDKGPEALDSDQPDHTKAVEEARLDDRQGEYPKAPEQDKPAEIMDPDQPDNPENVQRPEKKRLHLTEETRYISRSYVELGRGYLDARRIVEAKSAFSRALDFDEDCQECLDLLSRCHQIEGEALRIEGEQRIRDRRFDDAAAILERALALNSDDVIASDLLFQSHYQKALELYDEKKYLEAKRGFEAALTVKPVCADCRQFAEDSLEKYKERHYNDGIGYFGQEKLKQAISSWEKVVAVDPDYKDVRGNLRKATLMNERIEMIKRHMGNGYEARPDDP